MKKSEIFQELADVHKKLEELESRVSALEKPVALGETDSGGGPGSEDNGGG